MEDSDSSGDFAMGSTDELIAFSLLDSVKYSPITKKCLDYGGGKGHFANALIQKGCRDLTVYEPYGQNPGFLSVNWINDINNLGDDLFDWVFMIEVLEHLSKPQGELESIRKHIVPGGKLVILEPSVW